MGKQKPFWEQTAAEHRAAGALIKNQRARQTAETIKKNNEIIRQIQKLRGGIGGGGAGLGGPLSGRQIR